MSLGTQSEIDKWQLAINNEMAVAEGFEPPIAGLTIRCLTSLATPQELFTEPRAIASGSNIQLSQES
jgi:hypothetical protein